MEKLDTSVSSSSQQKSTAPEPEPVLHPIAKYGQLVRAYRVGFLWSPDLRCFVRIEQHGDRSKVELSDGASIPAAHSKHRYVVWNDPDPYGPDCVLRASPALEAIRLSGEPWQGYRVLWLNDAGKEVQR